MLGQWDYSTGLTVCVQLRGKASLDKEQQLCHCVVCLREENVGQLLVLPPSAASSPSSPPSVFVTSLCRVAAVATATADIVAAAAPLPHLQRLLSPARLASRIYRLGM